MLKKYLQEKWLGSGNYIDAVTWLRIVYRYQDLKLSPLQTILKAYDDMPGVVVPEFISKI